MPVTKVRTIDSGSIFLSSVHDRCLIGTCLIDRRVLHSRPPRAMRFPMDGVHSWSDGWSGLDDVDVLIKVVTGPDCLADGCLTWAEKDAAVRKLGQFPQEVLALHMRTLLDDLGVHLHAFVLLMEYIGVPILSRHASELVAMLSAPPCMRDDCRFFGAVQLVIKLDAAMLMITPAIAVAVWRRLQNSEDRRTAAAIFLGRCVDKLFCVLLESLASSGAFGTSTAEGEQQASSSHSSRQLEPRLRSYVLKRVCNMDYAFDQALISSPLALEALTRLQDDLELDRRPGEGTRHQARGLLERLFAPGGPGASLRVSRTGWHAHA